MERKRYKILRSLWLACATILLLFCFGSATAGGKVYTVDNDFAQGYLVGVTYVPVPDQLQLTLPKHETFPFIWVPNSNEGTVSKISTLTGDEIARYRTGPSPDVSPSRTTVDQDGSCWVGNRQAGTVVKIGLYEANECWDRSGNLQIETSKDLDNDCDIDPNEILDWGCDECVLYEVVLTPVGSERTYLPGEYAGPYDPNYWGVAPRGLAVDAKNNVWVGTWSTKKYYHLYGPTATIIPSETIDFSAWPHGAYGATIDKNGVLWSSGGGTMSILRIADPSTDSPTIRMIEPGFYTYGLGLDYAGHLFVTGWTDNTLACFDITSGSNTPLWTTGLELSQSRGVVATDDNTIWVANSGNGTVTHYDNNGNLLNTIPGFNQPTGVAVDKAGNVWACDLADEYVHMIDPTLPIPAITLSKRVIGGNHYTYSDMTGMVARNITTNEGTWDVLYTCGKNGTSWGTVSWNTGACQADPVPIGTSITVEVRSADSQNDLPLCLWQTADNGVPLLPALQGKYIEIRATLQTDDYNAHGSPVLCDLTVEPTEPTGLTFASASARGEHGYVALSWQMAVDVPASSFLIERSQTAEGEFTSLAVPVVKRSRVSFSCEDHSAVPGRTYWYKIMLAGSSGEEAYGPIEVHVESMPVAYGAYQSYPNPFNPQCTIQYDIAQPGVITLRIFDADGSLVRTLVHAWREPGEYTEVWNGRSEDGSALPSGVYVYRLEAGDFAATRKMVLLR